MRAIILLSVLSVLSCEQGGSGTPAEQDASATTDGAIATIDGAVASCTAHELPREIEIDFDGDTRKVFLAGPSDTPAAPVPLVLNFHGYSDDPEFQENLTLMSDHAVAHNYVVAYPEGTGLVKGWNAGTCCGTAASTGKKDVEFTSKIIEAVSALACVDTSRVYAVGYSNGGFLAHRLACELSEQIAGVVSVSGVMGMPTCEPTRAIPILQIHGTADAVVPYNGNLALGFPSVATTMSDWSDRRHCDATDPVEFFSQGDSTCESYSGCDAPLALCTVTGGGHNWPGGIEAFGRGTVSQDLIANDMILQFFGEGQ